MPATSTKEEAKQLIESLLEDSTWDDLMHEICVRQAIEAGLADSEDGRTMSVGDVCAKFSVA